MPLLGPHQSLEQGPESTVPPPCNSEEFEPLDTQDDPSSSWVSKVFDKLTLDLLGNKVLLGSDFWEIWHNFSTLIIFHGGEKEFIGV